MLIIIYGDDTAKSREYYLSERSKYPQKIILDGFTLRLTDFLQSASGNGLFGDQSTIFIEDLLSKRKPSKELDAIIQAIGNSDQAIVIYEQKQLNPKQLKSFEKATLKHFPIPKIIFTFVDSLAPGNGKKSISLFHELLKNEDANFALFMIQRQVRMLLSPGFSNLASWQKNKIEKQASLFSQDQLLDLHERLYQIELTAKTGQLSSPLDQAIDFLLLSL